MITSERLNKLLDEHDFCEIFEMDEHASSCTNGFDNDGSRGYEIFQNGFELAVLADGQDIVQYECGYNTLFFIGDEDEVYKKMAERVKEAYDGN